MYRFVFRSLYEVRAFNGDPHPGNYPFHRGGKVTFLDFGLVEHFTPSELQPLMQMARTICVEHDPEAFRRSLENAGFLRPGTPLSTQAIVEHLAVFSANWRAISEEIRPFTQGPATTPIGQAEAAWRAQHQAIAA
ncbi:MAG: AarF/UbiB family protein [Streptosporangiaceae bacterium]